MGRTTKEKIEIVDPAACLSGLSRVLTIFSEYNAEHSRLVREHGHKVNIHDPYIGLFSKISSAVKAFESETQIDEHRQAQAIYNSLGFMITKKNIDDRKTLIRDFRDRVKEGDIEVNASTDGFSFGIANVDDMHFAAEEFSINFIAGAAPVNCANGENINQFPFRVLRGLAAVLGIKISLGETSLKALVKPMASKKNANRSYKKALELFLIHEGFEQKSIDALLCEIDGKVAVKKVPDGSLATLVAHVTRRKTSRIVDFHLHLHAYEVTV